MSTFTHTVAKKKEISYNTQTAKASVKQEKTSRKFASLRWFKSILNKYQNFFVGGICLLFCVLKESRVIKFEGVKYKF